MRTTKGFTILELMIAVAIVGVLATLSYAGYQSSIEKSNFRNMQEFGIELALNQQLHRQRHGRYASAVAANGASEANKLVMPSASEYRITVTSATFRDYEALVTPKASDKRELPQDCKILVVTSSMGKQRFLARNASGADTSAGCIPHG